MTTYYQFFLQMDKTLVTVKVAKESQTVLDWYVVSVSTEQNFSQIFEAISTASNHALNNTRFTEKLRIPYLGLYNAQDFAQIL